MTQENEQILAVVAIAAKTAHEINRAYCKAIGDDSQPSWEDAPDWQKASAYSGVMFRFKNPEATPEQMHNSWKANKLADGWVYGPTEDEKLKFHPCIVPWAELPTEQKVKDYLFAAAVEQTFNIFG